MTKLNGYKIPIKGKIQKIEDFYLFESPLTPGAVYVLAHGSSDGKIKIFEKYITLEEALYTLYGDFIQGGVTEVYTLSCYGGRQHPAAIGSVTIQSCHKIRQPIGVIFGEKDIFYCPISEAKNTEVIIL